MLKKIKQRSFQRSIDKNLESRDISQVNAPLKSIGFLVDENVFVDLEALYDIGTSLGLQRKDVKLFSFVTFSKKAPSLRQNQIHNKDFSWKGTIDNQNANEFLDIPFDVLVGYYESSQQYLDAMVSKSAAKFKVGLQAGDERLFDLILSVDVKNTKLFKEELEKYMKILKKIN